MLLVIDVGNTNLVFGIYNESELTHDWRISTDKAKSRDEYGMLFLQLLSHVKIKPQDIEDVIISSVVPNLMHTISNMVIKYFNKEPFVVEAGIKTGLNILYDNPKQLGADRIVNAVAGIQKYGNPLIVIDVGTAITFCLIDKNKNYRGGLILPGISISADALFSRTSKLPKVEIIHPEKVIGTSTVTAMQAGLFFGFSKMIDGIIHQIFEENHYDRRDFTIVATGGFANLLISDSEFEVLIDKDLTLDGLRIIYEMNHS